MKSLLIPALALSLFAATLAEPSAQPPVPLKGADTLTSTDKKEVKDQKEKEKDKASDSYSKLLGEASVKDEGFINLYLSKGKLLAEIPASLLGREMLIGSTVSKTSDNGQAIVGFKPLHPLHVTITKHRDYLQLRELNTTFEAEDDRAAKAFASSVNPAILENFKIEAYKPDSSTMVIDMTDYFLSDNETLTPFDKSGSYAMYKVDKSLKRNLSYITRIKSFEDNASISSMLSYTYSLISQSGSTVKKDVPFTTEVTRSIIVLPEETYRPRLADYRIGVLYTASRNFSSDPRKSDINYYAKRWDIQPSDTAAYRRGELVDPVKHIDFYMDPNFPEWWKPYVAAGITKWNDLFEEIGFKDVIRVREFPTPEEDPEFDPDNMKYSCVRYAPIDIQNAMGPSWVDPRSGEIIAASVYVYHDVMKLLRNWLFTQTAQTNPAVRTADIPRELIGDALSYVIRHEVGHCLGFMHNMSGSYTYPVDSLRSPSFTQKYGTTPSIMDYARFNYIAQPGDYERGVVLNPPAFGPNDIYTFKWSYTPIFDAATPEEEAVITSRIISEAIRKDPVFRYGKQQLQGIVDPRAQSEDLGDDAVKATRYGIQSLKYIAAHMHEWTKDDDKDFSISKEYYDTILRQYLLYVGHVAGNIGGVYMNEIKAGDEMPRFAPLSREKQKEALGLLFEMYRDLDWIDDAPIRKELPLYGSVKRYAQTMIFSRIMDTLTQVSMYEEYGDDPFTFYDEMDMIYDFVWDVSSRKPLSADQKKLQSDYIVYLLKLGNFKVGGKLGTRIALAESDETYRPAEAISHDHLCGLGDCVHSNDEVSPISGFEWAPDNRYLVSNYSQADIYVYLSKARETLRRLSRSARGADRLHYRVLFETLNSSID